LEQAVELLQQIVHATLSFQCEKRAPARDGKVNAGIRQLVRVTGD
jgi:hypothetical protein